MQVLVIRELFPPPHHLKGTFCTKTIPKTLNYSLGTEYLFHHGEHKSGPVHFQSGNVPIPSST